MLPKNLKKRYYREYRLADQRKHPINKLGSHDARRVLQRAVEHIEFMLREQGRATDIIQREQNWLQQFAGCTQQTSIGIVGSVCLHITKHT